MRLQALNPGLPTRQTGAALLAFALFLVVGTAYILLTDLNINILQVKQTENTRLVLEQAKQALIGYAVTYPDTINANVGPGYLPCPDTDNNGTNDDGACSFAGNTTIGRFPYKRFEMPEIRDAAGERLWYIVSDTHKNNPRSEPLNSETPGGLTVDDIGDVVAIIIAPGEAYDNQDRDRAETDILNEIDNYLEDENTNLDALYVTSAAGDFNDQLIFITRQELMFAVEKRVMGEIFQTLNSYRANYTAYPWLSPFTDPAASAFRAQLDDTVAPKVGWQGHVPFHWAADPSAVAGVNPFSTSISVSWNNITGADIQNNVQSITVVLLGVPIPLPAVLVGMNTLDDDCLNNINCNDGIFPVINELPSTANLNCTWTDKNTADCESITVTRNVALVPSVLCPIGGTITRTYTVNFPSFTGISVINNPDATSIRTRNVSLDTTVDPAFLPAQNTAITISDEYTGQAFLDLGILGQFCVSVPAQTVSVGTSTFDADTDGILTTAGIHYDIDIDDGELPEWFVRNGWQNLIYVAYPEAETPPGSAVPCTTGVDCLLVEGYGPDANTRGVIISMGDRIFIAGTLEQDRVVTPDINDYLEQDNANQDQNYEMTSLYNLRASLGSANPVNDQVRILDTP